jgi:hypothetical protein
MVMAAELSARLGLVGRLRRALARLVERAGLPVRAPAGDRRRALPRADARGQEGEGGEIRFVI